MRDPSVCRLEYAHFATLSSVSWVMASTTGTAGGRVSQYERAATMARTATPAVTKVRLLLAPADCADGDDALLVPERDSSANSKSEACWKRCSGFLARQRFTILCSPGGALAVIWGNAGGSSLRIALMVSAEVGFWKARLPVNIS